MWSQFQSQFRRVRNQHFHSGSDIFTGVSNLCWTSYRHELWVLNILLRDYARNVEKCNNILWHLHWYLCFIYWRKKYPKSNEAHIQKMYINLRHNNISISKQIGIIFILITYILIIFILLVYVFSNILKLLVYKCRRCWKTVCTTNMKEVGVCFPWAKVLLSAKPGTKVFLTGTRNFSWPRPEPRPNFIFGRDQEQKWLVTLMSSIDC
jgi:hypothetical protein